MKEPIDSIVCDVPGTINALLLPLQHSDNDNSKEKKEEENDEIRQQYISLSVALILLGHGYADEAHDIITPLSWPEETHFGYGSSFYAQTTPAVIAMASYIHSLVHRREGSNVGEFGMVGYSNANFWTNASIKSKEGMDSLPFLHVRQAILEEAYSSNWNDDVRKWCQERIIDEGEDWGDDYWEPRALHELCSQVSSSSPSLLTAFAEKAAELELRVLLHHCLHRAGYQDDALITTKTKTTTTNNNNNHQNDMKPQIHVNSDIALSLASKVSSAHLNSFRSNGFVIIRNVLAPAASVTTTASSSSLSKKSVDPSSKEQFIFSAAAGIATRLFESPACKQIQPQQQQQHDQTTTTIKTKEEDILDIFVHSQDDASTELHLSHYDALNHLVTTSLFSGDLLATLRRQQQQQQQSPIQNKDDDNTINNKSSGYIYSFASCLTKIDPDVVFVDSLFGTRGETPTTVIQWSKGTIF